MLFWGELFLPFRRRLLLALIAAAGAGVYLTYSGLYAAVEPLTREEAGQRLFSRLSIAAAGIDSEIKAGLERARMIANRTDVREILSRRGRGTSGPDDIPALELRMADTAKALPGLTAMGITDARGDTAAVLAGPGGARISSETAGLSVGPKDAYVGPPLLKNGALFYEVAVPVPPLEGTGRAPAGVLRCQFKTALTPAAAAPDTGAGTNFSLAKRRGKHLLIAGPGGSREVGLKSGEAAPFLPALQGKEGYEAAAEGAADGPLYAYARLPSADWVISARTGRSAPTGLNAAILAKIRLRALLAFALLSLYAFLAANLLARPLNENARAAAALLEDCGKGRPEAGYCRHENEVISKALAEAGALIKARSERGRQLENETDKLREEEADLKYQNLELDKLNKYLLEREVKISELKKEISELKEKVGGEVTE